MREYPRNSPHAAARIVALAALADGSFSRVEMETVREIRVAEQLGLDGPDWHEVMTFLCQDLVVSSQASRTEVCCLNPAALERVMAEVDDPSLQRQVFQICMTVVQADGRVDEGESLVLVTAVEQWGLAGEWMGALS